MAIPPHLLKKEEEEIRVGTPGAPWLMSYSDLMAQILIFFIMMFVLAAVLNEDQLNNLKRTLDNYIENTGHTEDVSTMIDEKGLVISLSARYMFDPGRGELHKESQEILSGIADFLISSPNMVRVEGHTDNIPIATREFPSNWELSTVRAVNVARYFIDVLGFPARRIASAGYGEQHPVLSDKARELFQQQERRILSERQRIFIQNIIEEIPEIYRPELPKIRRYLLYEGVEWEIIVRDRMPVEWIDFIKGKENVELRDYRIEKEDRFVKICNTTEEMRNFNRRVDIIVERLGAKISQREREIRVRAPALPVDL